MNTQNVCRSRRRKSKKPVQLQSNHQRKLHKYLIPNSTRKVLRSLRISRAWLSMPSMLWKRNSRRWKKKRNESKLKILTMCRKSHCLQQCQRRKRRTRRRQIRLHKMIKLHPHRRLYKNRSRNRRSCVRGRRRKKIQITNLKHCPKSCTEMMISPNKKRQHSLSKQQPYVDSKKNSCSKRMKQKVRRTLPTSVDSLKSLKLRNKTKWRSFSHIATQCRHQDTQQCLQNHRSHQVQLSHQNQLIQSQSHG